MAKKIAPAAIVALKEALTHLYWYKSDLRSFLTTTLANPSLLANLNWDDYKRNVVSTLVDFIAKRPDQYQGDLLRLMSEVSLGLATSLTLSASRGVQRKQRKHAPR